jgi:uncharacterized protein (TIGR03435 family)
MNHASVIGATAALCLAAALSVAQDVRDFELVSVRQSAPTSSAPGANASGSLRVLPDGRFEARGEALANLARVAFGFDHVDPNRGVVQAADWMWKDRFDLTASAGQPWTTPPPGTTVPPELRTMLRMLLEDRFALRARIATKKVDVTALRLAKPERLGPGLRPSAAECRGPSTLASPDEELPRPRCPYTNTIDRMHAEAVTMPEVAQMISQRSSYAWRGLIVDQTGLRGLYDVSFSKPRRNLTPETSIRELEVQLGLTLEPTSMPLPTLIIERARKPVED